VVYPESRLIPITGKNIQKSLALAAIAESERAETTAVAPVAMAA